MEVYVQKQVRNKAVVELSTATPLNRGQTYLLVTQDEWKDRKGVQDISLEGVGSRSKFVAGYIEWADEKMEVGNTDTTENSGLIRVNLEIGLNFERFEFGPFVSYDFVSQGEEESLGMMGGAFVDYNFLINEEKSKISIGARVKAGYGTYDSTLQEIKVNRWQVAVGPVIKFFPFHTGWGINLFGGYRYEKLSFSPNENTKTGLFTSLGLTCYF